MAAARESISPLLNNVRARRLSLELCQKIGSHLLSPNRNNNVNPDSTPTTPKLLSGSSYASRFQTSSPTISPSQSRRGSSGCTSISPSQSRRGSSGCIGASCPLVTASLQALAAAASQSFGDDGSTTPSGHHNRRRSSLTPIYSNTPSPSFASCGGSSISDITSSFAVPTINVDGDEDSSDVVDWLVVGNCDLNNNHCNNYNTTKTKPSNNENIAPSSPKEYLQPPSTNLFMYHSPHHHPYHNHGTTATATQQQQQSNQRRKSFPTVTYSHNTNSNNNNKNQLDETLATLVAQQCSNLVLNSHEILGKGSFGTVIAAVYRGKPAAVKVIRTTTPGHRISLNGERNALRLQPHANIARIYEIYHWGPQNQALIVMEQLRVGSLLTVLNDSSIYLNGSSCIQLSAEIASALFYCHLNGILHLDVKPSNILMDLQNHCKLSDFGNSKTIQDLMKSTSFAKLDGTVAYIAPECFRGLIPTDKCDVYSFGITMWQILSRETPYQGETEHSIIYKVVAQAMRPNLLPQLHLAKFQSQEILRKYMHVYEMCWQQYPETRPNMKSVNECLLALQKC